MGTVNGLVLLHFYGPLGLNDMSSSTHWILLTTVNFAQLSCLLVPEVTDTAFRLLCIKFTRFQALFVSILIANIRVNLELYFQANSFFEILGYCNNQNTEAVRKHFFHPQKVALKTRQTSLAYSAIEVSSMPQISSQSTFH